MQAFHSRLSPMAGVLAVGFLAVGAATPAAAQFTAYTTTSVNQRAGPDASFPVLQTVPERTRITVYGCLRSLDWCEIGYRGRGWMSADYIQAYYQGTYYVLPKVAAYLQVPTVTFDTASNRNGGYRTSGNGGEANIGMFYDRLAPYGSWIELRGDYVWVPTRVSRDWRPYERGRWVDTDQYGWMWVSNEPFGWATYHYGRWGYSKRVGWFWVPGTRWAPAWVAWRHSNDHVAWAPLPPEQRSGPSITININSVPTYYWQVVPTRSFLSNNLSTAIIRDRRQTQSFLQASQPLGTVRVEGRNVVDNVLNVTIVEKHTRQKVVTHKVTRVQDSSGSGRISGTTVQIFQPQQQGQAATAAPNKPPKVVPLTAVEKQSQTKGQAGNEPGTANLLPQASQQGGATAPAGQAAPGGGQACPQGTSTQPNGRCGSGPTNGQAGQPKTGASSNGNSGSPTAPPPQGRAPSNQQPPPPNSVTPSTQQPPAPNNGKSQPPPSGAGNAPTATPPASQGTAPSTQPPPPPKSATPSGQQPPAPNNGKNQPPPSGAGNASTAMPPASQGTAPSTQPPPPPKSATPSAQQPSAPNPGAAPSATQPNGTPRHKGRRCPNGTKPQADGSCSQRAPSNTATHGKAGAAGQPNQPPSAAGGQTSAHQPPPRPAPASAQPSPPSGSGSHAAAPRPTHHACPNGTKPGANGRCAPAPANGSAGQQSAAPSGQGSPRTASHHQPKGSSSHGPAASSGQPAAGTAGGKAPSAQGNPAQPQCPPGEAPQSDGSCAPKKH